MLETNNKVITNEKVERVTRKWWFILVIILIGTIIPPYVSAGYDYSEIGKMIGTVLSQAIIESWAPVYPVFKIIPIVLIICLLLFRNKVQRTFNIYVTITYILFAIIQSISITEEYGLAIITGNLIMFLIVAAFWLWEVRVAKNDFLSVTRKPWKYWVVPLAFLAFWYPINPETMNPDFNPIYILTSSAGLAFCTMTPVYLAIITLHYPKINISVMRVTSLVAVVIAAYNMLVNFLLEPNLLWWNGVLHIPLLSISIYSLILSFRRESHIK